MRRLNAALLACVPFVACALPATESEPADGPTAALGLAIEGGYLDATDTAVVGIVHLAGGGVGACSGSLIAPNVVLTAQHCVAPISGDGSVLCGVTKFGAVYGATSLYVTTKTSFTQSPADYHPSKEILVPPGDGGVCGQDLAVVVLKDPIDPSEALPVTPRVDSSLLKGEEYYAVGYGQQYDSDGAPSGTRYRRDELFTQCVGDACVFDSIEATEFLGDTGVCSGDSGGPAFDLQNRVAGVASRGAAGCEYPTYGHVYGWGEWLKGVTAYATSSSGIEIPAWANGYPTDPAYSHPVGDACDAPEDCASNACLNGYCTRLCIDAAPCPATYACNEAGLCERVPEPKGEQGGGEEIVTASCAISARTKDPTKPIPWMVFPVVVALAGWRRRVAPPNAGRPGR